MSHSSQGSFFYARSWGYFREVGILSVFLLLASCATIKVERSYKNPEVVLFHANRVLVVGMTPDMKAREQFETKLQEEFSRREVDAVRSIDLFDVAFTLSLIHI